MMNNEVVGGQYVIIDRTVSSGQMRLIVTYMSITSHFFIYYFLLLFLSLHPLTVSLPSSTLNHILLIDYIVLLLRHFFLFLLPSIFLLFFCFLTYLSLHCTMQMITRTLILHMGTDRWTAIQPTVLGMGQG